MKQDGHLGRNFLAGSMGDAINLALTAVGHNLRLLRAGSNTFSRSYSPASPTSCPQHIRPHHHSAHAENTFFTGD